MIEIGFTQDQTNEKSNDEILRLFSKDLEASTPRWGNGQVLRSVWIVDPDDQRMPPAIIDRNTRVYENVALA